MIEGTCVSSLDFQKNSVVPVKTEKAQSTSDCLDAMNQVEVGEEPSTMDYNVLNDLLKNKEGEDRSLENTSCSSDWVKIEVEERFFAKGCSDPINLLKDEDDEKASTNAPCDLMNDVKFNEEQIHGIERQDPTKLSVYDAKEEPLTCDPQETLEGRIPESTAADPGPFASTENMHQRSTTLDDRNLTDHLLMNSQERKHQRSYAGMKPYKDTECGKAFSQSYTLLKQQKIHTAEKPYKCTECNTIFRQNSCYMKHFKSHTAKKTYLCTVCNKNFAHASSLKNHLTIHTGEKHYRCPVCNKSFSAPSNLKHHSKIHTGEKPYRCPVCKKTFRQSSNLKQHSTIHTGEKPYECTECLKTFRSSSELIIHLRFHTGEKPYKCTECLKTFSVSSNLKMHSRIHTGEKPYICTVCLKCFSLSSGLKRHSRIHTAEKPYKCTECKKTFRQSSGLLNHSRMHTGEKPYGCTECRMSFSQCSHLLSHLKIHTGEKPFLCAVCNKTFSRSTTLNRHTRIHTDENPYVCLERKKCFRFSSQLIDHQKNHTGETGEEGGVPAAEIKGSVNNIEDGREADTALTSSCPGLTNIAAMSSKTSTEISSDGDTQVPAVDLEVVGQVNPMEALQESGESAHTIDPNTADPLILKTAASIPDPNPFHPGPPAHPVPKAGNSTAADGLATRDNIPGWANDAVVMGMENPSTSSSTSSNTAPDILAAMSNMQGLLMTCLKNYHIESMKKLTGISQAMSQISAEVTNIKNTVAEQDLTISDLKAQNALTQKDIQDCTSRMNTMEMRLENMDSFARRNNIRIINIPEQSEGPGDDITDFVASLIYQYVTVVVPLDKLKVDIQRAHRVPRNRVKDREKPRHIKVNFLTFAIREQILQASHKKYTIEAEGYTFFCLPDECPHTGQRRWELKQWLAKFRAAEVDCTFLKSVALKISWQNQNLFINTKEEAEKLLDEIMASKLTQAYNETG